MSLLLFLIKLVFDKFQTDNFQMNNKFWNAPAWSLGNRYGGRSAKEEASSGVRGPGPGSYDISGKNNKLGCKMGTSTRGFGNRENQPGPGNYNISSKNDGPKISLGTKFIHSGLGATSFTPGPGNYNTASSNRPGSGVTMGAKYGQSKLLNEEPGPGSYTLTGNGKPGVKIGTSKRGQFGGKQMKPGPGQYTYDKRPYSAGPKYGFGKAGRGSAYGDNAPGPGQYDMTSFIRSGDNHGCTMGQRFKKVSQSVDLGPGPGYYDSDLRKYASGAKIGKAKRGFYDGGISPGPGAYDTNYRSMHGAKIGTSKRGDFSRAQTPGPGSYDMLNKGRGGITISGHKAKSRIEDVPGPGAYDLEDYSGNGCFSRDRPCSAKIGKALRTDGHKAQTPGPGQYYHSQTNNYKFAYTKQLRSKDPKRGDPGPGQYQIPSSVPSAPHYLIDPNIYKSYGSRS